MPQVFKLVLKKEVCPVDTEIGLLGEPLEAKAIAEFVIKLTKDMAQEVQYAFYFSNGSQLLGYQEVAVGGFSRVNFDAKVLYASAILCGATNFVLVHNHPLSSNARFSPADIKVVKGMIPGAESLGLTFRDNIVVCGDKWMSMREFGLMPNVPETMKEAEKAAEGGRA